MSARRTGRNRNVSTKGICQDARLAGYSTAFKYLWRVYVQACLRTGRTWQLEPGEVMHLLTANCHYCGCLPANRTKIKQMTAQMTYNGIDRVDNNKGYESANVVSCCKACNSMKSAQTPDEFVRQARRITEHQDRLNQTPGAASALQPHKGSPGEGQGRTNGCDPLPLRSRGIDLRLS